MCILHLRSDSLMQAKESAAAVPGNCNALPAGKADDKNSTLRPAMLPVTDFSACIQMVSCDGVLACSNGVASTQSVSLRRRFLQVCQTYSTNAWSHRCWLHASINFFPAWTVLA